MKRGTPIDRRPVFSIIMIGGLAILLPLLALLQYRWIGQISDLERERLPQNLRVTTAGAARDIIEELDDVVDEFRLLRGPRDRRPWEVFAQEEMIRGYDDWQATSPNPALLRNVYLYSRSERSYRRFDPATGSLLEASPAVAGLDRWMNDPAEIPREELLRRGLADQLWIFAPVRNFQQQFRGPGQRPAEWTMIFEIDAGFFWSDRIPEIINARFDQEDYRVALQDTVTDRFLYTSDASITPEIMTNADADWPVTAGIQRQFWLVGPRLHLAAQHQLGSLAEAVDGARRRNLAVGFGILALLGVAGAMIIIWSERVRSVGRLQMEFAAGISHELRTPLATIRTAAHNIASGIVKDPEQVREYAEIVQTEGRRLSGMVDQTIQFAQIEAGRRHYDMEAVGVQDVIDQAIQNVRALAQEGGNAIEVQRRGDIPRVMADPTALTHCLANLLTNAVKFGSPAAPIAIEASHDPRKDRVRISVHNQGPGIDVDELPHLFEPFYRGHNTSRIPGSGLGLSLVRRMMTRQKGEVTVETAPGAGATFTLHIPVAPEESRLPAGQGPA
jgi:signal transduction histidine kinase